jgi:hypothetical protein
MLGRNPRPPVAIPIAHKSFERISLYAELTGIGMERAASEALDEWMDKVGDDVISRLLKQQKATAARKLKIVWRKVG